MVPSFLTSRNNTQSERGMDDPPARIQYVNPLYSINWLV